MSQTGKEMVRYSPNDPNAHLALALVPDVSEVGARLDNVNAFLSAELYDLQERVRSMKIQRSALTLTDARPGALPRHIRAPNLAIVQKDIKTGKRGGAYYINDKGKVVYLKARQKGQCSANALPGMVNDQCPEFKSYERTSSLDEGRRIVKGPRQFTYDYERPLIRLHPDTYTHSPTRTTYNTPQQLTAR
jgi:hypothetical protein